MQLMSKADCKSALFLSSGCPAEHLEQRGDPGLYLTPTFGLSAGTGVKTTGSATLGVGWFTGNPQNISRSMLIGHTFGASVSGAFILGAGVCGSYSPVNPSRPFADGGFINFSVSGEVGLDASPATSVSIQGNYQYTPAVGPLLEAR